MDEKTLNYLMSDAEFLNKRLNFFIGKKLLFRQNVSENEIKGHIEKAEHNINFVADIIKEYSDWAVVGCYYACYHSALALILRKGFFSKNHDATLCLLIKYYYKELDSKDIDLFNRIYFDNQDILFYVDSKKEREKASYSSQFIFDNKKIRELRNKILIFVNKCREILNE